MNVGAVLTKGSVCDWPLYAKDVVVTLGYAGE
jgi:hypothetical protein